MKREPIRSIDQNRLMWQMLTDWAAQEKRYTLNGEPLDAHDLKELTMAAFMRETRITPSLDGKGVVFLSRSTSRLSKDQMNQYITFLEAEGLSRGIVFRHIPPDPQPIVPRNEDELREALRLSVEATKEQSNESKSST